MDFCSHKIWVELQCMFEHLVSMDLLHASESCFVWQIIVFWWACLLPLFSILWGSLREPGDWDVKRKCKLGDFQLFPRAAVHNEKYRFAAAAAACTNLEIGDVQLLWSLFSWSIQRCCLPSVVLTNDFRAWTWIASFWNGESDTTHGTGSSPHPNLCIAI